MALVSLVPYTLSLPLNLFLQVSRSTVACLLYVWLYIQLHLFLIFHWVTSITTNLTEQLFNLRSNLFYHCNTSPFFVCLSVHNTARLTWSYVLIYMGVCSLVPIRHQEMRWQSREAVFRCIISVPWIWWHSPDEVLHFAIDSFLSW